MEKDNTKTNRLVALTTGLFSLLLAWTYIAANNAQTEQLVWLTQAGEAWRSAQAKEIKSGVFEAQAEAMKVNVLNTYQADDLRAVYMKKIDEFERTVGALQADTKELKASAEALEEKSASSGARARYFYAAQGLLFFSIFIAMATILTGKRFFWFVSVAFGLAGGAAAVIGLFFG